MGKQIFNIRGMMRDLSPSKTPNDFAYEIRNLRLTAQEDSTMLTLVSEKSNRQYTVTGDSPVGKIIGYCTLNNYLVLFTYDHERLTNIIYRLELDTMALVPTFDSVRLYEGELGMGASTKIEAIGIYENVNTQKVYWIDGVHQPRFINIVASASERMKWYSSPNPFDFVPTLTFNEKVEIEKASYSGVFNAGTIQYILTYYNKNGQQTASFYQSPIRYTAYSNRGASPEDTVNNSFNIRVYRPDTSYDYVRIYSVFRSSENGTPICKRVADIRTNNSLIYEDKTIHYTIDTSEVTETAVPYSGPHNMSYFLIEVIDSSDNVVDLENFLIGKEGSTASYLINSDYYILITRRSTNAVVRKIQAAEGKEIHMWMDSSAVGINRAYITDTYLRCWGDLSATIPSTRAEIVVNVPYLEFIDNGLSGETVNYSDIIYSGGANIIPSAMAQKNQTLFFGNYRIIRTLEEDKDKITNHNMITFGYSETAIPKGQIGTYYMYESQLSLSDKEITTFKGGETYYFGVILQDANGSWTEVIPLGSATNRYYPCENSLHPETFYPVKAYICFDSVAMSVINKYKMLKIVRLQTPASVVYQGALCPTVFSNKRDTNAPYCQSSWFFRDVECEDKVFVAHKTQNKHNGNIIESGTSYTPEISEIQGAKTAEYGYYDPNPPSWTDMDMFVDWNTLTLHSPDIEFGQAYEFNYKMRIIGILPITSGRSSMQVTMSTPPKLPNNSGVEYTEITHNNLDTSAYELDLNIYAYKDGALGGSNDSNSPHLYPIYPWHRNGSLTAQDTPSETDTWFALLDTKVMASIRESAYTKYMSPLAYEITGLSIYQDDNEPIMLAEDVDNYHFSNEKLYLGSIDTVLTHGNTSYFTYGKQLYGSVIQMGTGNQAVRMKYRSTKHGIFSLKSTPNEIFILPNVTVCGSDTIAQGSLANIDPKAEIKYDIDSSSVTITSEGLGKRLVSNFQDAGTLAEGDVVTFQGNTTVWYVTSVVSNTSMRISILDQTWLRSHLGGTTEVVDGPPHSTPTGDWTYRIYFTFVTNAGIEYYSLDYDVERDFNDSHILVTTYTFHGKVYVDTLTPSQTTQITQPDYPVNSGGYSYIYIAELFSDSFAVSYEENPWYAASEPLKTGNSCVIASIGDTYYQRYDCLKTYPYTLEDQNQIVEIFSFMCETKVNIDGRYDNRRGMADNTTVTNTNFNLLNRAYTQEDNFITYHYLDPDDFNVDEFPNQLIWTMTKVYGSDIDAWTQIVPTSTLDMDGSLGEVRALRLWNDNLLCFQDMGIAKIMYNERTTMSTEQGIPVEIANSGKVDGSQYLSNSIGCKNKESIKITQEGIYFIDSNTREIYRFSKGLESLSKGKGFNTYMQGEVDLDTEKTFYDSKLKDVYFRFNRKVGNSTITECLVFNEQLGEFTSFFDYDMDFLFPFKDSLVAVEHNSHNLWKQFDGDSYLRYFGQTTGGGTPVYKNYSIQLVSADNPLIDKIFTGLEFRADVISGSIVDPHVQVHPNNTYASANALPFQTIQVWNEYQDTGNVSFQSMIRSSTNLSQKFRIWRGEIGRDSTYKLDRIRSPWARIKLTGGGSNLKTVIHDVAVAYM